MAPQLPLELETEILLRLPPQSLVCFRSVSKQWNSLLKNKIFVKNYFSRSRPQLFFYANCKAYLIDVIDLDPNSIGPRIDLCDLPSIDLPLQDKMEVMKTCDEFSFCICERGMGFLNPLLKQVKSFEYDSKQFFPIGLGYDNSRPEKAYKVLGLHYVSDLSWRAAIYDCASQVFKFIDQPVHDIVWHIDDGLLNVCWNGNLYWVCFNGETCKYFIQSFDFSMETFKPFSLIPCQKSHQNEGLVLGAFKADRLSLLWLPYLPKEIEIWVTEKTINREQKDVVWIKLMSFPATNFPRPDTLLQRNISYFIYDKTLFMCCDDYRTGVACIYIVREDLCKRIQIDTGIRYCHHSFFTPNFIYVPYFRG